jgi:hypothetical protein
MIEKASQCINNFALGDEGVARNWSDTMEIEQRAKNINNSVLFFPIF